MLTIVVRSILDHRLCNQHLTWIDMYFKVDLAIKLMSDCQRIYNGTFPMCHISWEMQKNKKSQCQMFCPHEETDFHEDILLLML